MATNMDKVLNPMGRGKHQSRAALDEAVALSLISLDYVGPITGGGDTWYILVINYHTTRYMVAQVTATTTAAIRRPRSA